MLSKTLNPERIFLGILLLIFGVLKLSISIWSIQITHEWMSKYLETQGLSITYFDLILPYHLTFVLSLLSIIAGFLVLIKHRHGWTLGLITSVYYCLFVPYCFFKIFVKSSAPNQSIEQNESTILVTFLSITWFLFLLATIFLLLNKTRLLFNFSKSQVWIVLVVMILIITDWILI